MLIQEQFNKLFLLEKQMTQLGFITKETMLEFLKGTTKVFN